MRFLRIVLSIPVVLFVAGLLARPAQAEGDPHKAKHIIVIMQENHSFDNYFGALAYAPGSPYHSPRREDRDESDGGCRQGNHACVDGLACRVDAAGNLPASTPIRMTTAVPSLPSMIRVAASFPIWTTAGPTRIAKSISITPTMLSSRD